MVLNPYSQRRVGEGGKGSLLAPSSLQGLFVWDCMGCGRNAPSSPLSIWIHS